MTNKKGFAQVDSIIDETTGELIEGITFPLAMAYKSTSKGVWFVPIPGSVAVTLGQLLDVTFSATAVGGKHLERHLHCEVVQG